MKMRRFKFGKYLFDSFQEFKDLQNLAIEKGFETQEEFEQFLKEHFKH